MGGSCGQHVCAPQIHMLKSSPSVIELEVGPLGGDGLAEATREALGWDWCPYEKWERPELAFSRWGNTEQGATGHTSSSVLACLKPVAT